MGTIYTRLAVVYSLLYVTTTRKFHAKHSSLWSSRSMPLQQEAPIEAQVLIGRSPGHIRFMPAPSSCQTCTAKYGVVWQFTHKGTQK